MNVLWLGVGVIFRFFLLGVWGFLILLVLVGRVAQGEVLLSIDVEMLRVWCMCERVVGLDFGGESLCERVVV